MLTDNQLVTNQWSLDWIWPGRFDLAKAMVAGQIIFPDKTQSRVARKTGYTFTLIVPGMLSRDEIINAVSQKYAPGFDSNRDNGVCFWFRAEQDRNRTVAALNPCRPQTFYAILLRPELEAHLAHPETEEKNPDQLHQVLQVIRAANPILNLHGLVLPEYLLFDVFFVNQDQRHLNVTDCEYLLGETIPDTGRALDALWAPGGHQIGVGSNFGGFPRRGARFVVVPKIPTP